MTDEIETIDKALDALLRAAIADDLARQPVEPRMTSATAWVAKPIPTRQEVETASLLRSPVGSACRHGIRRLGEHLFKVLGSTTPMIAVAERVAGMDPAQWGYRTGIIDSAWNGIGAGDDRWWS